MIKVIKKIFTIASATVLGSMMLWNCESDADNLGSQFFQSGAAQSTMLQRDVLAFNINNNDTIRTDAAKLDSATLGAFTESNFGMQKSSYVSQVRLSTYAFDFGTNPVVDSAVIVIKPSYSTATDSLKTTTDENYVWPDGSVAAKKVVNTYPVIYKYGKSKIGGKTSFTINVNEVNDFLGSTADKIYSNKTVATGTLLGTKTFNGNVSSVAITKDSDASTIWANDPNIRIPLSGTFFQNKIIAKKGSFELADAASFIRYFNGLRISVAENDGYIFKFVPNEVQLIMYYKNDLVTSGVTTRPQTTYAFDLTSTTGNVHFSQIENNRVGTPYATAMNSAYPTPTPATTLDPTPATKLYPQGMGGAGFGIRIPAATITELKTLYANNKIGIVSAKIRLNTDASSWLGNYKKPDYFVVKQKDLGTYLTDIAALTNTGAYNLVKATNLYANPAYYDIGITQTLKNIIETNAENKDFYLNVGSYTFVSGILSGTYYAVSNGQDYNTRSYTPNRVVLVGTDTTSDKRAQLLVVYGSK